MPRYRAGDPGSQESGVDRAAVVEVVPDRGEVLRTEAMGAPKGFEAAAPARGSEQRSLHGDGPMRGIGHPGGHLAEVGVTRDDVDVHGPLGGQSLDIQREGEVEALLPATPAAPCGDEPALTSMVPGVRYVVVNDLPLVHVAKRPLNHGHAQGCDCPVAPGHHGCPVGEGAPIRGVGIEMDPSELARTNQALGQQDWVDDPMAVELGAGARYVRIVDEHHDSLARRQRALEAAAGLGEPIRRGAMAIEEMQHSKPRC